MTNGVDSAVYSVDYPNTWKMEQNDKDSELERWFHNYKLDKYCSFASSTEWLVIEAGTFSSGRKTITQYKGEIGSDLGVRRSSIQFEVGAPPPPTFYQAAKELAPKPGPRVVSGDAMWRTEQRWLREMYYEQRHARSLYHYDTGWLGVRPSRSPLKTSPPVEPRYRTNS